MTVVKPLAAGDLAWANERYAEIRFLASSPEDFLVVGEVDGERAGLGRLVPADAQSAELGGIYVLPEFRGRGLARAIVAFLLERSPYSRLFCIPFRHLEAFYRGFGFEPVSACGGLPPAIAGKLDWCAAEHSDCVVLLARNREPCRATSS